METKVQQIQLLSFPKGATDGFAEGFKALASGSNMAGQNLEDHSKHAIIENSGSGPNDHGEDQDGEVSDCESGVSGGSNEEKPGLFGDGLIRIQEDDRLHQGIKLKFLSGLKNSLGLHSQVEAIHRSVHSSFRKQANLQSFQIFLKAMEQNRGGNANLKFAWYGASKDEIIKILTHGFGDSLSNGVYGCGVYLSPFDYPLDSLQSSVVDEDGLRHLLLCRVIMGRTELIHPGCRQSYPSSEDYDLGVDNLESPRKYIVWSTHMNTHILPEFVVSFRAPTTSQGCQRISVPLKKPNSPWMCFPALISELSKVLPLDSIKLIKKYHRDHKERRITRQALIQMARQIAGDRLLIAIIKSFREKHFNNIN